MSYYWKNSRSGKFSRTYESLIIDVLPNSWSIINNRKIWHTSFEELESFFILRQDIEVINNPTTWTTKIDYIQYVNQLGYSPSTIYSVLGGKFVLGQAQIGRHSGIPLPWGFISDLTTPIDLDVTNL